MTELITAKKAKECSLKYLESIIDEKKIADLNTKIQKECSKGLTSFEFEGKLSNTILDALKLSGYEVQFYYNCYLISWE